MIVIKSNKKIKIKNNEGSSRGQAGCKQGASRGQAGDWVICCAIIPPLKRTQNVTVAEATLQNQSAEDSG